MLAEYIGQQSVKQNLEILLAAARQREEAADHVLLYGPPGLGKTTLANIIARELGVNLHATSGPAIERPGDLAAILTNLEERDVLFIDEIHRLNHSVEEILYPAMEDFAIDVMIGRGPSARSLRLGAQAVHRRRRDDARRSHRRPAARSLRRGLSARLLLDPGRAGDDHRALGGHPRRRHRSRGRRRPRAPGEGHAARRQSAAAARARLRPGSLGRSHRRRRRRQRR